VLAGALRYAAGGRARSCAAIAESIPVRQTAIRWSSGPDRRGHPLRGRNNSPRDKRAKGGSVVRRLLAIAPGLARLACDRPLRGLKGRHGPTVLYLTRTARCGRWARRRARPGHVDGARWTRPAGSSLLADRHSGKGQVFPRERADGTDRANGNGDGAFGNTPASDSCVLTVLQPIRRRSSTLTCTPGPGRARYPSPTVPGGEATHPRTRTRQKRCWR